MNAFTDWENLTFAHPIYFVLLLVVPFMVWWNKKGEKSREPSMRLTTLSGLNTTQAGYKARYRPALLWLRGVALTMLVIALARPQLSNIIVDNDSSGIDIVLAIDVSGSMQTTDFKPTRLGAAKQVAQDFIDKRVTDRIGLVIFESESITVCPITIDHGMLKTQLSQIGTNMMPVDGTAIGYGLATAVSALRSAKGASKVVILMTDGRNNRFNPISPLTALDIANAYNVKVYTIGIGAMGMVPQLVYTPMGNQMQMQPSDIDEKLLQTIADKTGGKYFRATGNTSLQRIYDDIDKMEKTDVQVSSYKHYKELFFPFALIAVCCISLELLLRYTVFKSVT